jgi:protein SCO1/2
VTHRAFHRVGGLAALFAAAVVALLAAAPTRAQVLMKNDPPDLQGVDLVPRLGATVPLKTTLIDSSGQTVELGKYFNQGKPVVLALVYYNCPMICPLVLQRLQERLNALPYTVGEDFNVVVVSFDPNNTTKMAAENKEIYLLGYKTRATPAIEAGWTFHTAPAGAARVIAEAIGFKYKFLEESGQYAHPAVLTVLTSDGRVSRYISGLEPQSNDLRLALLEASQGKIAKGLGDFFLHRCYLYDPKTGRYTIQAMRVMQMGGLVTVAAIGALLAALRAGERMRRARTQPAGTSEQQGGRDLPAGPLMGQTP